VSATDTQPKQEQRQRLPGKFISFKSDKNTKTLLYWSVSEVWCTSKGLEYPTDNTRQDDY